MNHYITIDGKTYEFMMVRANVGWMVHAPGLVPFGADNIAEARDTLRSAYAKKAKV